MSICPFQVTIRTHYKDLDIKLPGKNHVVTCSPVALFVPYTSVLEMFCNSTHSTDGEQDQNATARATLSIKKVPIPDNMSV